MVRKFCLLVIFPLAVMGCSSNTMLTVHSEPAGAELTTVGTGVPLGRAPAAAPDLEQDIEYAKGMRLSDIEWHRREQQRRTQFFPQQIPSKPNSPSQSSRSKSP